MRLKLKRTIGIFLSLLLITAHAFSQDEDSEWEILNREVVSFYQKGQYGKAVAVAKKALEVAESNASVKIIPMCPRALTTSLRCTELKGSMRRPSRFVCARWQ